MTDSWRNQIAKKRKKKASYKQIQPEWEYKTKVEHAERNRTILVVMVLSNNSQNKISEKNFMINISYIYQGLIASYRKLIHIHSENP